MVSGFPEQTVREARKLGLLRKQKFHAERERKSPLEQLSVFARKSVIRDA